MIIKQVLNNNVAIAMTNNGEEVIAMGKGIVFKMKKGDYLSENTPEKIFRLDNKEVSFHLQSLIQDVPIAIIATCCEILDNIKHKFNFKLQDYIYITLTNHLHQAINRLNASKSPNITTIQIEDIYPKAFEASVYALSIIKRNLDIVFPVSEANHIALHIINAEQLDSEEDLSTKKTVNITLNEMIKCMNEIGINRNKSNEYYYDRFLQHLKYFAEHNKEHSVDCQHEIDVSFQQYLKDRYPKSFQYASEFFNSLSSTFNIVINPNHLFYFQLHIERILSSQSKGGAEHE
nr:PRD domain-containing protein [Mammaliicoccus sp. Marseille-Q6498]